MRTNLEQYRMNVEQLVDEYYNMICDGNEKPFESETQYMDYIIGNVFDMRVVDHGYVQYGHGICDNLKFLGSATLYEEAIYFYDEVCA